VYAPLGAARRHRALNILAAFAASAAWHVLAVLSPQLSWLQVAAVATWAAVNAAAVILHVEAPWRRWRAATARVPRSLRIAVQVPAMWALGSLTVTLLSLGHSHASAARLGALLRLLTGLW
jgi:ABC-type Co2+ transport system permease subunit